jgi:hypothetical protein
MWGALSDERTGLSFARVTVRSSKSVVSMYNLHVIKRVYTCTYVYMYVCINVGIYNIYKASESPGSVQQIMPYY